MDLLRGVGGTGDKSHRRVRLCCRTRRAERIGQGYAMGEPNDVIVCLVSRALLGRVAPPLTRSLGAFFTPAGERGLSSEGRPLRLVQFAPPHLNRLPRRLASLLGRQSLRTLSPPVRTPRAK